MKKRRNKLRIKTLHWYAPATNAIVVEAVQWVAK